MISGLTEPFWRDIQNLGVFCILEHVHKSKNHHITPRKTLHCKAWARPRPVRREMVKKGHFRLFQSQSTWVIIPPNITHRNKKGCPFPSTEQDSLPFIIAHKSSPSHILSNIHHTKNCQLACKSVYEQYHYFHHLSTYPITTTTLSSEQPIQQIIYWRYRLRHTTHHKTHLSFALPALTNHEKPATSQRPKYP